MLTREGGGLPASFGSPVVYEATGEKLIAAANLVNAEAANLTWLQDDESLVVRGIYKLTKNTLQYCFAQPGKDRPSDFKVTKGCGRTLVHLKRFSTGEAPLMKELAESGVYGHKDEIGWVTSLQFRSTDEPLHRLVGKATALKKLNDVYFEDVDLAVEDFKELSRVTSLTQLSIQSSKATVAGLDVLDSSSPLNLLLRGKGITDKALERVAIGQLKTLHLQRTALSGRAIGAFLDRHPKLVRIDLDGIQVDESLLSALGRLKNLKTLKISSRNFGDAHAGYIARIKSLHGLLIQGTDITDAGLEKLTALENLTFLRVGATKITDAGLRKIAVSFPKLTTLYLWGKGNRITNDGVRALVNHPSLNEIHTSKPIDDAIVTDIVDQLRRKHRERKKAAEEQ